MHDRHPSKQKIVDKHRLSSVLVTQQLCMKRACHGFNRRIHVLVKRAKLAPRTCAQENHHVSVLASIVPREAFNSLPLFGGSRMRMTLSCELSRPPQKTPHLALHGGLCPPPMQSVLSGYQGTRRGRALFTIKAS